MTTVRRGRPRIIDQGRTGDTPREEILDAAAELFITHGYTATSTRAIADAVGIRQSSIYHHFETKDDILDNLLLSTVDAPATLARQLLDYPSSAASRLYVMVWYDSYQLLASRWNLGVLFQLPESRGTKFPHFESRRQYLRDCYGQLAHRTCVESSVWQHRPKVEMTVATALPFHFVESATQIRLDNPEWLHTAGAGAIATGLADACLRGLTGTSTAELKASAKRILSELSLPHD
ncbi:TetR/AcrR family transcriptional regulator [Mycobacterium sp.]|uniref:TetR/AcrR family transcriptional regulator n=1 Tax=Mycobacterium sp. TaxID=1785 RepID=UPI0031D85046